MSLTNEREWIAGLLGTNVITSVPGIPARLNPPLWLVTPGSPYIEGGNTFGKYRLRLVLTYVSNTKANLNVTTEVDAALDEALPKLLAESIQVETVSQPFAFSAGGAGDFTAVQITISYVPDTI